MYTCHLQKLLNQLCAFAAFLHQKDPNLFLVVSVYVMLVITLPHAVCFVQEPDCLGFFHSLLH